MRFSFSDEQEQFRASLRRFLTERSPPTAVRRAMATSMGYDPALWQRLNADLGLAGLHLPEAVGGAGFGCQELGIVMEEMGRALCCAPYFASAVLATEALRHGATPSEQAEFLPALASGTTTATLAWMETGDRWNLDGIALTAQPATDGYVLEGVKRYVVDGHSADLIIVAAREPGKASRDIALFLVAGTSAGLTRRALRTIDETRKLAELEFRAVPARRVGLPGSGAAALDRTFEYAAVALAHEMIGAAQALLESTVDYAKLRMQFGRPIGSFQAIKHKCAELLLEVELAKAAVYYAAAAQDEGDAMAVAFASQAKAMASEACLNTAREAIQIHGGIGFTWDHDTHLWFKRAQSAALLLGDAAWHRERYLALTEQRA
jgi:alkylation response protein AidB-like acyl-CoA dehydrogenase